MEDLSVIMASFFLNNSCFAFYNCFN